MNVYIISALQRMMAKYKYTTKPEGPEVIYKTRRDGVFFEQ